MRRDSVTMGVYRELPGILCIATLIGCFFFTFFHITAYVVLSPKDSLAKEYAHSLKTQAPTNAQQFLIKAQPPSCLNHYEVLDIPWFSPVETVKKAYREKLVIYCPDRYRGDEEEANVKIYQARVAYETLMSKKRCMYDFDLGSGIRHFVDCNQAWLDRENEMFNEKLKEAKERRRERGQNKLLR